MKLKDVRVGMKVVPHSKSAKANTQIEPDPVNNPSHYTNGEIECIDAIKASMSHEAFMGFLKGNVLKYLWRYEKKVNPEEDIKKAGWYRERLEKELHDNSKDN
jgi:hypothetical protein